MVAIAAPAQSHLRTTIQNRSRNMLSIAENARNTNGVLLSPRDLSTLDR